MMITFGRIWRTDQTIMIMAIMVMVMAAAVMMIWTQMIMIHFTLCLL